MQTTSNEDLCGTCLSVTLPVPLVQRHSKRSENFLLRSIPRSRLGIHVVNFAIHRHVAKRTLNTERLKGQRSHKVQLFIVEQYILNSSCHLTGKITTFCE